MTQSNTYLDNSATTFVDPRVAERIASLYQQGIANPASQHRPGRVALSIVEEAKNLILSLTNACTEGMESDTVVVTSGGTESNNLALYGFSSNRPGLVILGGCEHPSLFEASTSSLLANRPAHHCRVDTRGRLDLNQLSDRIESIYAGRDSSAKQVALVSIMLVNNETGVIEDLGSVVELCRRFEIPVHSDVVQGIGKVPFSMREIGLDAITISAHKFHGPVGVGALVVRHGNTISPLLIGGGQQLAMRPGTESVVAVDAMAYALQLSLDEHETTTAMQSCRERFEAALTSMTDVVIVGSDTFRAPHISNVAFLGCDRQALLMALDMNGIACSTGSACASGSGKPSHVLMAMGLPEPVVSSALRFSLSRFTTDDEIDRASEIIVKTVAKLRSRSKSATSKSTHSIH